MRSSSGKAGYGRLDQGTVHSHWDRIGLYLTLVDTYNYRQRIPVSGRGSGEALRAGAIVQVDSSCTRNRVFDKNPVSFTLFGYPWIGKSARRDWGYGEALAAGVIDMVGSSCTLGGEYNCRQRVAVTGRGSGDPLQARGEGRRGAVC